MHVHYFLCNGKSQARAPRTAGTGLFHPVKLVEYQRQLLRRYDITVICNGDRHHILLGQYLYQDSFSVGAVLDGIADQVIEQTGKQIAVSCYDFYRYIALQII